MVPAMKATVPAKEILNKNPGSVLNKNQPRVTQGGFMGSENQKSGITTKRMDQLAPNLAHMGGFIWEWTYAKNN